MAKESVQVNPKMSQVPVTVYIRDMNDNFPEFSKPIYEVSTMMHFVYTRIDQWIINISHGNSKVMCNI